MALIVIPSFASNLLVMRGAGHFRATLGRFWPLYLSLLPGVALGLFLLDRIEPVLAAAVLGAVLMAYSGFALARPGMGLAPALWRPLAPPVGFATGLVTGLTGCQVMPVLPYLLALRLDANRFVQAINCSACLGTLAMAVGLSKLGIMTWQSALLSAGGLIPVYLGIELGSRARRLLSEDGFRIAVLGLLAVLGAGLIGRPWLL